MGNGYLGFVLAVAFIVACMDVVPTAQGAEGYWSSKYYESMGVRGAYLPSSGLGGGWICRTIDSDGKARVGAYFFRNHACIVNKQKHDNIFEGLTEITDVKKFQFLLNDGAAKSYAWVAKKDVKSLNGAIEAGSAASQEKTYVCRGSYGILDPIGHNHQLEVFSGVYYPSEDVCFLPKRKLSNFDILFDLYSMCDTNLSPHNPSKEGTWSGAFNADNAVQAGPDVGGASYVCRVRKDSQIFLGKHIASDPACVFANGDRVESSQTQEVLVSSPTSFYGWAPHSIGIIDGAMQGAVAANGKPVFICRALADTGSKAPLSPGGIISTEEECVTTVENRVARNPNYEVLVDMRRTCADRQASRGLRSGIVQTNRAPHRIPMHDPRKSSERLGAPMDAIKKLPRRPTWPNFLSQSNHADEDEYLERGLNVLKQTLDAYYAGRNSQLR